MRVFAAIPLPDDVVSDLGAQVADAAARPGPLRWTTPSAWHLTLAFFGTMNDDGVAELRRRLTRTSRRHQAVGLGLHGGGHFGRRVLWVGVRGDVGDLQRLARSVTAAGRRAGATVDEQARYRPHVTLARLALPGGQDPGSGRAAVVTAVDALRAYEGPAWTASEFTLVRSELGAGPAGRARHTVLETFPLKATAARALGSARSPGPAPRGPGAPTGRR